MIKLAPLAFIPLAPGVVRPAGWLKEQLQIQANGLVGHLDEMWPDVAESAWIGGKAEGWERGPYWLDGMVPLAFALDDQDLIAKADTWIEYILSHQLDNGWLGPVRDERYDRYEAYDPWPVFVTLKALTQYQEATGDNRIVPAMERFLHWLDAALDTKPLFSWGQMRWADLVISIYWLYDRTEKDWLLNLADKVHKQGTDWLAGTRNFLYTEKTKPNETTLLNHVVNNAMAIKSPGVRWRQSGNPFDRQGARMIVDTLDRYHGQATGVFAGDEHLAGKNPSQGTELCSVVEYMYSLEVLSAIQGDPWLFDHLEKIAFNALPATFSPDMWTHQYDQQANQAICCIAQDRVYVNNHADANIYGLEPNFGCCTANCGQGWPKFATHAWMHTQDDGLVCQSLVPCALSTAIKDIPAYIECASEYPFRNKARITISTERKATWPLFIRIPGWAQDVCITLDEQKITAEPGTYLRIEYAWEDKTIIDISMKAPLVTERRFNDAVAITRGPLVFALRIGENWQRIAGEPPAPDYEIHPTTPWNYALSVNPDRPEETLELVEQPVGQSPFSPEGAPLILRSKGRQVPLWKLEHNAAAAPPLLLEELGPEEPIELIPYGCTNLRMTELPVIAPETLDQ